MTLQISIKIWLGRKKLDLIHWKKKPMKNDFTKNKPQEDNEQALA